MKRNCLLVLALMFTAAVSSAATITFDLSPPGTDNAVGLSPLNETPPVTNSTGSGNEIGSGIAFDTDTLALSFSLGYGSAFGFTDLTGPATVAHIHGPASTNVPAAVLIDLAAFHVPATNPASGGSIVGSVTLTTNQASDLLASLLYINVHTASNPSGEIRGQLIPVNTLPELVCPGSTNVECTGEGTFVSLTTQVSDADGDALTVVWSVNGVPIQTNNVAAGGSTNLTDVTFGAVYDVSSNQVSISVSDGQDAPVTCTTAVNVVDTTPPTISSASVTPNVLWPPNHKFIPVQVSVTATDLCGSVTSKITSITSNQGVLAKGSGHTPIDWKITGDLTALVRAERAGPDKNGRTYTLTIVSTDDAGNSATTTVTVFVPHDQGKHNGDNSNTTPSEPSDSKGKGNGGGNGNSGGNGNGNGNSNGKGNGKNK